MTTRRYIVYEPEFANLGPALFLGWNRRKKQFQFYPEREKAYIWIRKKDAKLVSSMFRETKIERLK